MSRIFILNGPNLNLLGTREPSIYGTTTLAEIEAGLKAMADRAGAEIAFAQSNHEGVLVDLVQEKRDWADVFIVNAGAYTHTSVALRDALAATGKRLIEVHLSNVHRREAFRRHSYLSEIAEGVMAGFGPHVYRLALEYVLIKAERATP
ncbi:MAG: type II 3-dehydroquinate dehydratase [Spirochaetes bacterium]|nr:type II 3-dehydroquinate dehydratase [Spirochaetota bacterium]